MKQVTRNHYERGDHVILVKGYQTGMVGTVISHDLIRDRIEVALANSNEPQPRPSRYSWDDDDEYESNTYSDSQVKYISKEEYENGLKDNKILRVEGLPVTVQYKRNSLMIGDNVITPANAKKLAEFITENTKTTRKKKK